jgi:hypothetical protein
MPHDDEDDKEDEDMEDPDVRLHSQYTTSQPRKRNLIVLSLL